MLINGLFIFGTICFGAASANLDCDSVTRGEDSGQAICNKIVTPSKEICEGSVVTTTVLISTKIDVDSAKPNLDCGIVKPQGEQPEDSEAARLGEVPWHAGVYAKAFKPYKQICEGALVSATVVISAAHCFWNATSKSQLSPRQPAARYAVAVGKLRRPWDAPADGHAQKSDVREISIPVRFRGSVTNYQEDIAVVRLETPVQFTTVVRPACLDFDYSADRSQLATGKYGKLASWSIPEPDSSDEAGRALQIQELPYVDIPQCFAAAPASFHPYITSDKFCAFGKDSFSVVCRGAAGAGLTFPGARGGVSRHYLRGVVSASAVARADGCSQFIGFTHVARHEHFIKEHL